MESPWTLPTGDQAFLVEYYERIEKISDIRETYECTGLYHGFSLLTVY